MSTEESMMTFEEALRFLQDVLSISSPLEKLKSNRKAFLQEMMMAWYHHIPFQSIKMISVPHGERHKPTFPEIKEDILSKLGGVCYDHNVFFRELMRVLGYDAHLAKADGVLLQDCHVLNVVQNLTDEGSRHAVDVGTAYPIFQIISLDFDRESPKYRDSYLRYKFARRGEIVIRQHHGSTDPGIAQYCRDVEDGWYSFFYNDFEHPRSVSYFHEMMTKIYTDPMTPYKFLTSPKCMAWPNGRFVCIKDTTLLLENEEGIVEKHYFQSLEEVLDAYGRYFPQITKDMLKTAYNDKHVKLTFHTN